MRAIVASSLAASHSGLSGLARQRQPACAAPSRGTSIPGLLVAFTRNTQGIFFLHLVHHRHIHSASATPSHTPGSATSPRQPRMASSDAAAASGSGAVPRPAPAIVWFRNDLRVHDNEALLLACGGLQGVNQKAMGRGQGQGKGSPGQGAPKEGRGQPEDVPAVVPVYCFDPRQFSTTYHFGLPKTGAFRAQFIWEAVADLRQSLRARGSDLIVRVGPPEVVVPQLAVQIGAAKVYAQMETTDEETRVERNLLMALRRLGAAERTSQAGQAEEGSGAARRETPVLELVWGSTMYHLEDLPFAPSPGCPDIYTQFRKSVESRCEPRKVLRMPTRLPPFLSPTLVEAVGGVGDLPDLAKDLGVQPEEQDPRGVLKFVGGETAALARVKDYIWTKDRLRVYKETRNGMVGADYSSKFSVWLAHGCISPRFIYEEVQRYEKERVANESTYWLLFELIWRDYFRFLSMKCGNTIFKVGGPRNVRGLKWTTDRVLFDAWREGRTGYPLVDANMRELRLTGFMSNRGRQIVCSFLVRDMGLDWRMGAEWFESILLDYDPCSNYGNWTYGAGVGTDPREDRYFSIPKQAQNYDSDASFVSHWLPELASVPRDKRHSVYNFTPSERAAYCPEYPPPIVKLKMGNFAGGQGGKGGGQRKGYQGGGKQGGGSKERRGKVYHF